MKTLQSLSISEELHLLLNEMKFVVTPGHLQNLLMRSQSTGLSHEQFLLTFLKEEFRGKTERKLTRSLKYSHLGSVKTLDVFDFSVRGKLSASVVKSFLDCEWIREGRSILCIGKSGTGKTHVAKALGYAACDSGFSVYYGTVADIVDEIHASLADNSFAKVFRRYTRTDLIIAEDISYPGLDQAKADHLFRLVGARYPTRSMIVTANTGFENWGEFFPNQAQGIATVDRLVDQATILRFTGKSFRKPRDIYGDPLDKDI